MSRIWKLSRVRSLSSVAVAAPCLCVALCVCVCLFLSLVMCLTLMGGCGRSTTTTVTQSSTTTTVPANSVVIDESADGTTVHVTQGYTLVVRLHGNPSTGYTWKIETDGGPLLRKQGDYSFTPDRAQEGTGGVFQAMYKAEAAGTTSLAMEYVGPDSRVDHNFYVDVIVETAGGEAVTAQTTTSAADQAGETRTSQENASGGAEEPAGTAEEGESASAGDEEPSGGSTDTSETPAPTLIRLGQDDDGSRVTLRKGDRVLIELQLHPVPDLMARPIEPDRSIFEVLEVREAGGNLQLHYRARAAGKTTLGVEYVRRDGSLDPRKWSVKVVVEN